jgi:hypothetical protein
MAQAIEHLPCKHKTLSSDPSTTKTKSCFDVLDHLHLHINFRVEICFTILARGLHFIFLF